MDWDEILNPLSPLYQDAMYEQQQLVNMQDGLIDATKKMIETVYPQLYHLESEGYKELESVIITECVKFSCKINEVINRYHINE
jgi:hypothetical protein